MQEEVFGVSSLQYFEADVSVVVTTLQGDSVAVCASTCAIPVARVRIATRSSVSKP